MSSPSDGICSDCAFFAWHQRDPHGAAAGTRRNPAAMSVPVLTSLRAACPDGRVHGALMALAAMSSLAAIRSLDRADFRPYQASRARCSARCAGRSRSERDHASSTQPPYGVVAKLYVVTGSIPSTTARVRNSRCTRVQRMLPNHDRPGADCAPSPGRFPNGVPDRFWAHKKSRDCNPRLQARLGFRRRLRSGPVANAAAVEKPDDYPPRLAHAQRIAERPPSFSAFAAVGSANWAGIMSRWTQVLF